MKKITTILFVLAFVNSHLDAQTTSKYLSNFHQLQRINSFALPADTIIYTNLLPCDSLVFSYGFDKKNPIDSGWMEGNNYKLTKATAEYFAFGSAGICVDLLGLAFSYRMCIFLLQMMQLVFMYGKQTG